MHATAPANPATTLKCARDAFTLVELLVAIAVIALLISLLLPGLSGARQAGQRVKCQVNQRQLITAATVYAGTARGVLPMPNWASQDPAPGWLYIPPLPRTEEARENGLLWPLLESGSVYRCPAHVPPYKGSAVLTSYLMNGAVAGYGRRKGSAFSIDLFDGTAMAFWEADEAGRFAWNDGASYPREGLTRRHGRSATVAVMDGSTRPVTHEQYFEFLGQSPGPLWCAPDRRDGH